MGRGFTGGGGESEITRSASLSSSYALGSSSFYQVWAKGSLLLDYEGFRRGVFIGRTTTKNGLDSKKKGHLETEGESAEGLTLTWEYDSGDDSGVNVLDINKQRRGRPNYTESRRIRLSRKQPPR